MDVLPLDTLAAWADAVARLPAGGPLPARCVLVPSERHAHALRRALASSGRQALLAGTRFVGPLTAAMEVLAGAGVAFAPGEEALRPGRLLSLFREDLPLEHFPLELLRSTRGWEQAFAGAIGVLEAAGLGPSDLPGDGPQLRDLGAVWARAAAEAGTSWSSARIQLEAASLLEREPGAWPFPGPALAAVSGHESAAAARFLRAIPELTLGVWSARPLGARHLARIERLLGSEVRGAAAGVARRAAAEGKVATERDLLAGWLFERAEALADPARPRSEGPDGTVHLEEHAGVEAELEAAADWVARKVLEDGLPLEEIAVLVPVRDPLAALVAERIERLPLGGGPLPVHVAGGRPATSIAAGARILAVLRALGAHLSAERLAEVLPALRLEGELEPGAEPRTHLTHGEALELAYALGTVGGNAARPEGALEWSARAAAREGELEAALAHARADEDSAAREQRRLARALRNLRAVRPALDGLVAVARTLLSGAPLAEIWEALGAFLARFLLAPGEGASLPARLGASLAPTCAGAPGRKLAGTDALEVVEAHLRALRIPKGRFGEPAVYVGTVEGAAGLDFAAARIVGLCEGVLPSQPRENPVLPERLRAAIESAVPGRVVPGAEDRVAEELHALLAAIQGARRSVALSAPRVDLARTEREPAALLVEAAAALGRPGPAGERAPAVPDAATLRRDAFGPARLSAAAFRAAHPVTEASWLDRVARLSADLPPAWSRDPSLELGRIEALRLPSGPLGPADGLLGAGDPFPAVPGVGPSRPVSASGLEDLLQCPRMFLMKRILGWDEPASAPSLRELDALAYGSLLHRTVEELYRAHGAGIVARRGSLAHWLETALAVGDRLFDAFLSEYPLVGAGIRVKERARLRDSLAAFVAYDWGAAEGRRFVGVEVPFGERAPLEVSAGGATLHVRGFIDRVDADAGTTLVRDLKSGRAHPRSGEEVDPTPTRDVQIGLYQLAARKLASAWSTPEKVAAAYVYANGKGDVVERAFVSDAAALERATEAWLATSARLLHGRLFPATPDEGDCRYCPFRPLCGSGTVQRAREGLEEAEDGALADFRSLKLQLDDEEDP